MIKRIFLLFVLAQILGMYVGAFITEDAKTNEIIREMKIVEDGASPLASFQIMLYILIGAAMMLIIIKFVKFQIKELLLRIIEFGIVSMATSVVIYAFIRPFLQVEVAMISSIIFGLFVAAVRLITRKWKNLVAVVATAGAGAVFGFSLSLGAAFLFLVLLTIYDYIAVFRTKHMVTMAEEIIKKDVAFTVSQERTVIVEGKPKKERIDIGTGDFLAPIMVEVAAYKIGMGAMLTGFVGAVLGFWIMIFFLHAQKKTIPAIPPITLGIAVAYGVALLLNYFIL
ncbi:MAG: presenilin family intramembrane aspartyl protease [Candidatus Anstonellales archaeon]